MYLNIKENAIFIADAHCNQERDEFSVFLDLLEEKKINTSQLFLMGDMFDFLTQESFYFIKQNSLIIERLNKLSQQIEMIYLEGNHDFNLEKLFPNILIIPLEKQPLYANYDNKEIAISHGDNFTSSLYKNYSKVIRNSYIMKFLNSIDFKHWLSKKVDKTLSKKKICHNFTDFETLIKNRLPNYSSNIVIEGHFHQGKEYTIEKKRYINVPSLFCSKSYMILEQDKFIAKDLFTK